MAAVTTSNGAPDASSRCMRCAPQRMARSVGETEAKSVDVRRSAHKCDGRSTAATILARISGGIAIKHAIECNASSWAMAGIHCALAVSMSMPLRYQGFFFLAFLRRLVSLLLPVALLVCFFSCCTEGDAESRQVKFTKKNKRMAGPRLGRFV